MFLGGGGEVLGLEADEGCGVEVKELTRLDQGQCRHWVGILEPARQDGHKIQDEKGQGHEKRCKKTAHGNKERWKETTAIPTHTLGSSPGDLQQILLKVRQPRHTTASRDGEKKRKQSVPQR